MTTVELLKRNARLLNQLVDEGPRPVTPEMASYLGQLIYDQLLEVVTVLRGPTPFNCEILANTIVALASAGTDLAYLLAETRKFE